MKSILTSRVKTNGYFNRLIWAGLFFVLLVGNTFAANLTLSWNPSTSSNIRGYRIYYGLASGNYTANVDAGNVTTFQVNSLTDGKKYFFAVKTYNVAKTIESGFSNEISAVVSNTSTLTSNFTANKTSGAGPLSVAFTADTTGTVTGFNWDFGASAIPNSTLQNPTVTYSTAGTYDVSLTVTGPAGTKTMTKTGLITVTGTTGGGAPSASFTAFPRAGNPSLSVAFNDTSSGNVSSRLWDFGDGTTSTVQNPNHVYANVGSYTVTLTVTGSGGSNTKTTARYVNVFLPSVNDGLVAAYNFEENGNLIVADASGKGNHGTIREAARTDLGRYGKALLFDGINDWVTVNDSASLDLSSGYTLEAWVKPSSLGYRSLIAKEDVGSYTYCLLSSDTGNLPAALADNGTSKILVRGNSVLPLNQWSHLTATYNGSQLRIYVNGVQVSSQAQTGLIKKTNGVLRIGGNNIWGEYFKGTLDDLRIYNRALTNSEIANNYVISVNVTNPSRVVAGNIAVETAVDSSAKGIAEAFKTKPQNNNVLKSLRIYLDEGSTATELVAGIYDDNSGHPGKLLTQGKVTSGLKAGTWNRVPVPSVKLIANNPYWIAILSSQGLLKFRDHAGGTGNAPLETSASTTLTSLPATWATGTVYPVDGPISANGTGYQGP